jgi:uroporphyrinogen III methyltransferase/synthase
MLAVGGGRKPPHPFNWVGLDPYARTLGMGRVVRVIVTRPRDQAGPLVERIEALGHEVVVCPLIEIVPTGDDPVDTAGYDWVVLTSPNGAEQFARRRRGPLPKLAAVGPGTAETLRELDLDPQLVPRLSTQEGLLAEFPRPPGRVLVAAARGARRTLIDGLGADFAPLYDTTLVRPTEVPAGDLVVLASGSAARSFGALGADVPAVSIGPQTTRAAELGGLHVVAEAKTHDLDGLVEAVAAAAAQ